MKTLIGLAVFLPTTSRARQMDFLAALEKVAADHKGHGAQVTISGPYHDDFVPEQLRGEPNAKQLLRPVVPGAGDSGGPGDGQRSERQSEAARDFGDEGGAEPGPEPEAGDGKPAAGGRKPRSDAGKPRGPRGGARGAAEGGSAAEGPERRPRAQAGAGGNGDGRAAQGDQRGGGEGEGQDRGPRGGGRGTGRAHVGDGQAAQVAAQDEDWGGGSSAAPKDDKDRTNRTPLIEGPQFDTFEEEEEWWSKTPETDGWPDSLMPEEELTRAVLSGLLSDHFRAHGGKDKATTFDLIHAVTGEENLDTVTEEDFDKLARALLRDTAAYRYGAKKPVTATRRT